MSHGALQITNFQKEFHSLRPWFTSSL